MKVSNRIVDMMVRNNIVKEEERDVYDYGIDQILFTGLNIMSMILIGIVTHSMWTIFLFSLFYMVLRIYAGGYHADTQLKCFALSNLMILVVVGIDKMIFINTLYQVVLVVISSMIILKFGPVDTISKQLDYKENEVYKARMVMILIIEVVIFIILLLFRIFFVSKIIAISFFAVMIMLTSGVIDNLKRKDVQENQN